MVAKKFAALLVDYLINEYFDKDEAKFARHTEYTRQQIQSWRSGLRSPHAATIRWMLSCTVAPEFMIAVEFQPVNFSMKSDVSKQLKSALNQHYGKSGIYAFYDSMCNVVYVGKASSGFGPEMYQQLRASLGITFPKAIRRSPAERWQVVKYVSAYEIPEVEHLDYPKHVEALVLRLSKPVGNKVLGSLQTTKAPKEP